MSISDAIAKRQYQLCPGVLAGRDPLELSWGTAVRGQGAGSQAGAGRGVRELERTRSEVSTKRSHAVVALRLRVGIRHISNTKLHRAQSGALRNSVCCVIFPFAVRTEDIWTR